MFLQRHQQRHANKRQQQPPQCECLEHLESLSCEEEHRAESTCTHVMLSNKTSSTGSTAGQQQIHHHHTPRLSRSAVKAAQEERTSNTYFTDLFQRRDKEVIADDCQRVEHVHSLHRRREKAESGDCPTELNSSIPTHARFDLVQTFQENKMLLQEEFIELSGI